ncbi:hypothetical protein [Burkholderia vietnamiensis]|uniref:hypothetical protein n=1 Tax=Burkholderia vietnamiensis TaxID=60552 RepID=UPI001D139507|nr:hypothetical protein [Burkholderia vietnamiensis]UEC01788.1 hypothetical protein LK462_07105 [Burkholderia vietnamiensis]
MRKAIFLFFLLLGIGIGFLSARHDGLGLQSIMMAVGAMFGGAIGGGLSQIGKRKLGGPELLGDEEIEPIPGGGTSDRDLAANYWRDKGQPPFTRMPDAEPDKHVFDPDRIG